MIVVLTVLIAYLMGSIPFALLAGRLHGITDLRSVGSGNLGATNVWRQVGAGAAIIVFVADIGKGALAVAVARICVGWFNLAGFPVDLFLVLSGLAAVIGHVFPVYIGFKGGKGVAVALGVMLSLLILPTILAVVAFAVTVAATRFISLGSMIGAVVLSGTVLTQKYLLAIPVEAVYVYMSLLLTALVFLTHRQNIVRLLRGVENRLTFSATTRGQGGHA